jgi:hypothetical protein
VRRISLDGGEPSGFSIHVNECRSLDAVAPVPFNREGGLVFFDVEWFGVPIAGQPCSELIGGVQQPRIASLGGKQDKLADGDDAPIVLGGPAQSELRQRDESSCRPPCAGRLRA